jgi:hypothetical protein
VKMSRLLLGAFGESDGPAQGRTVQSVLPESSAGILVRRELRWAAPESVRACTFRASRDARGAQRSARPAIGVHGERGSSALKATDTGINILHLLCNHYVPIMLLLCNHYATIMQLSGI